MTPANLKAIRHRAGLSQRAMAKLLRIADQRTIRHWECGTRAISGPGSILLEMLDAGELPGRYTQTMTDSDRHAEVTSGEAYVRALFEREHPWAIHDDGSYGIVEFCDSELAEAYDAGRKAAVDQRQAEIVAWLRTMITAQSDLEKLCERGPMKDHFGGKLLALKNVADAIESGAWQRGRFV